MDRYKSFETFLIASDPVWVWDSDSASIVWANAPARRMFGEADGGALRNRVFPRNDASLKRLTSLARARNGSGQWEGDLPLPGGSRDKTLRCEVQRLQLTGGARGVIVRVLPAPGPAKPAGRALKAADEAAGQGGRPLPNGAGRDADALPVARQKSPKATAKPAEAFKPAVAIKKAPGGRRQFAPARKQGNAGRGTGPSLAPQRRPFRAKAADLDVLAGLSHDLRNPLTAVLGFAEIMKEAKSAGLTLDKIEDYAASISRSALFALDLANSLMHYARFGRFEDPVPAPALDSGAVLRECVRLITPVAAFTSLRLTLRIEPDLPLLVMDERSLKQILFNLLLNSIKFSRTGGEIRIKAGMSRQGELVIAIDDPGPGSANAMAEPKSLQIGVAAEIPSAGIGLTVVKRLLKSGGARLSRRKKKAGGMSVKLIFPGSALMHGR